MAATSPTAADVGGGADGLATAAVPLIGPGAVAETEEVSQFFMADALIRLRRLAEQSFGIWASAAMLYLRLLAPGGEEAWGWLDLDGSWVIIFLPLFFLDWRNISFWKYLHANRTRFPGLESYRFFIVNFAEFIYKALMCLHLAWPKCRSTLTAKVAMFPYAFAYLIYFIVGHFVPLDDEERPEGCNVLAGLLGDLSRFLGFVLLVSISMKVDGGRSEEGFTWEAAFWPCWGLEGVLVLGIALLLPICMASIVVNQAQVLMLSWVIFFCGIFGVLSFSSMYNLTTALDGSLCPDPPKDSSEDVQRYAECRERLQATICPWLVVLPAFAASTWTLRRRLAAALHLAWFDLGIPDGEASLYATGRPRLPDLPPPEVLFRVTMTYYSRHYIDATTVAFSELGGSIHSGFPGSLSTPIPTSHTSNNAANSNSAVKQSQQQPLQQPQSPHHTAGPHVMGSNSTTATAASTAAGTATIAAPTAGATAAASATTAAAAAAAAAHGSGTVAATAGSGVAPGPGAVLQPPSPQIPSYGPLGSLGSSWPSLVGSGRVHLDPSASLLSARGGNISEIVESEQLCFVCYDQPPKAVLMECGHAGLCTDCAVQLMERRRGQVGQCPICRSHITCVLRLREDLPLPASLFTARPSAGGAPTASAVGSGGSGLRGRPEPPLLESMDLEAGNLPPGIVAGPPFPPAAKANAVMVEVVRRRAGLSASS